MVIEEDQGILLFVNQNHDADLFDHGVHVAYVWYLNAVLQIRTISMYSHKCS